VREDWLCLQHQQPINECEIESSCRSRCTHPPHVASGQMHCQGQCRDVYRLKQQSDASLAEEESDPTSPPFLSTHTVYAIGAYTFPPLPPRQVDSNVTCSEWVTNQASQGQIEQATQVMVGTLEDWTSGTPSAQQRLISDTSLVSLDNEQLQATFQPSRPQEHCPGPPSRKDLLHGKQAVPLLGQVRPVQPFKVETSLVQKQQVQSKQADDWWTGRRYWWPGRKADDWWPG